jgi:hypothetical protein
MASWIGRITGSREAQLATTAVVSGVVVAGAIFGYQSVRRRERVGELKADIPELNDRSQGHIVGEVCSTIWSISSGRPIRTCTDRTSEAYRFRRCINCFK